MPTMPNVVGMSLDDAQEALESAGVVSQALLGYFYTWPIIAAWQPSKTPPSTVFGQTPNSGATVAVNSTVTLKVSQLPTGVAFP